MWYGDSEQAADTSTVSRTRPWLIASAVGIFWCMLTIAVLHVVSSRDPILDTLSSYAFTDQGAGMLEASILSLAVGSLFVLAALIAAGVRITRTTRTLFGSWTGGLTLAAAFPASYGKLGNPVSGEIHQYACLIAFLSLPAIGFSVLREISHTHRVALARWTWLSAGALVLFGLSYVVAAFPSTPALAEVSTMLPVGVTQRIALVADVVLLFSLLVVAGRTASTGTAPAPAPRAS